MILTEATINKFKRSIITEGVHLPHGTKSAKIVTHVDLDGAISAISLVNQLVKQGIPKNRITIEFAQYGDDEKQAKIGKSETDKFISKKGQWVGVTDYAKYPKSNPWETFNKLMGFKGNKYQFVKFANSRDFSKIANVEDFKKIFNFDFNETKFTEASIKELYQALKAYCKWGKKDVGIITPQNVETWSVALVKPDFGSDHHSNEDGELSAAQRGDLAANSPSEAEFFANKYAPGLWSKDDLEAVSVIDSAGYTKEELKNAVFLEKHFTGPNKKRNLASIVSVVYDSLVKKDEKVAKWVILNSGTSLVSFYSTTINGLKLNGERLRLLQAIRNGDMKTGKEIAEALPKILKKNWSMKNSPTYFNRNGDEINKASSREEWAKKNKDDLEKAVSGRKSEKDKQDIKDAENALKAAKEDAKARKVVQKRDPGVINATENLKKIQEIVDGKKGKIFANRCFTFFDGSDTKQQYSRFTPSLISRKGYRNPYTVRYWQTAGLFQIAVNPFYKEGFPKNTELVDFSKVNEKVLQDVEKYLADKGKNSFYIANVMKKIKGGGHKSGIWTWSGFTAIKPTSKERGKDYYDDLEKIKRASNLMVKRRGGTGTAYGKARIDDAKEIIPNTAKRFEEVENGVVKDYKELQNEVFKYALNRATYWTETLYPPRPEGLEALKNDEKEFELKA